MKMTWWKTDIYCGREKRGSFRQVRRLALALALAVLVTAAAPAASPAQALKAPGWQTCRQYPVLEAPGTGHLLTGSLLPGRLGGDDDDEDEGDCSP